VPPRGAYETSGTSGYCIFISAKSNRKAVWTCFAYFGALTPAAQAGAEVGVALRIRQRRGRRLGVEDFFLEADGFGRDFDEFILGDELDGGLQRQNPRAGRRNFLTCENSNTSRG